MSSCIVGGLGNTGLCLLQKAVKRNDILDADFVELIDPGRFEDEHGLDKRSVRLLKKIRHVFPQAERWTIAKEETIISVKNEFRNEI